MLAVAGVGNVGYDLTYVTKHVAKRWNLVFMVSALLAACLGTLPRCGAIAYEVGLKGMFPNLPGFSKWIFLVAFFALAYFFASNKSGVVDAIGKFLTPILLVSLVIIIVLEIVNPIGKIEGGIVDNGFSNAFLTAYNTGDVGTGIICAGIFIAAIRNKGYTETGEYKKMMFSTIIVAFILLFIVYGGLCYIGAQRTKLFPYDMENTPLLIGLINQLAGYAGIVFLSVAIVLACLTTLAGMTATISD